MSQSIHMLSIQIDSKPIQQYQIVLLFKPYEHGFVIMFGY